uniref:Sodium-dependent phosphate transport protein 2A n=1 Tax=Bicosoecida sp. CB-2014 TaxID=1486930 RepID=A0A7S1CAR8_9STRA
MSAAAVDDSGAGSADADFERKGDEAGAKTSRTTMTSGSSTDSDQVVLDMDTADDVDYARTKSVTPSNKRSLVPIPLVEANRPRDARWFATMALRVVAIFATLYVFLVGLTLLGDGFKVVGGKTAGSMFESISNPIAGLVVGVLATVLVQSSSTSTSIVVSLVGSGIMSVTTAIPVIFGANIGTSVTNTLVSIGHVTNKREYQRAFAAATVHDAFNLLNVLLLLPLEVAVAAINGVGGPLYWLSVVLTEAMEGSEGAKLSNPVKDAVSPIASLFVKVDKDKIRALSIGAPALETCLTDATGADLVVAKVNYAVCGDADAFAEASDAYQTGVMDASLLKSGAWKDAGMDDGTAGTLTVILGIVVTVVALLLIVKQLQSALKQRAQKTLVSAGRLNGCAGIAVGTVVTIAVQSSSITTSTLTPLVGVGALTLEQVFPLTLGANIGTTCTALLASLVAGTRPALQIALCHLIFNVAGVLVFFPHPRMRGIPLAMARALGRGAARFSWFPPAYTLVVFFIVPLSLLGISSLYDAGAGALGAGVSLTVVIILAAVVLTAWYFKFGGKAVVDALLPKLENDADLEGDVEMGGVSEAAKAKSATVVAADAAAKRTAAAAGAETKAAAVDDDDDDAAADDAFSGVDPDESRDADAEALDAAGEGVAAAGVRVDHV